LLERVGEKIVEGHTGGVILHSSNYVVGRWKLGEDETVH